MTGFPWLRRTRRLAILSSLTAFWITGHAAPPAWVTTAASLPVPSHVGAATALVLLDETAIDVDATGLAVVTHRFAIRILAGEGRGWAEASVGYLQRHDIVRRLDAWLVRNGDVVPRPSGSSWLDLAADTTSTLYSDYRLKQMDRSRDAAAGDVFAAETILATPLLLASTGYSWGWTMPVVMERFQLSVPAGFTVAATLHGDSAALASRTDPAGRTFTWEMAQQPYVRSEPFAPAANRAKPTLFATLLPPAGAAKFRPAVVRDWTEVAVWIGKLNRDQCDSSARLSETVHTLTAACTDQLGTLRALSRYVQQLRYVARNDRIGDGYGYQAHKASEVFAAGYGDCKDKANLLVAMLRDAHISAFIAAARIGDDREVWPDCPSPGQFDHAIVAIQVDDTIDLPAIVRTEKWGRVLFFDATDPFTLLGDLPTALQGTRVFVQHPESDRLIELPRLDPTKGNLLRRHATLELAVNAAASARIDIRAYGQAGAEARGRLFRATAEAKRHDLAAERLSDALRSAQLRELAFEDDASTGICGLTLSALKPGFCQLLPGGLAMVPLNLFPPTGVPVLSLAERRLPVKWPALALDDEVAFKLPTSFLLEEAPSALAFETPYGIYRRTLTVADGTVTLRRQLALLPQVVAPSDYASLKKFAADIAKADRTSLLLRQRN